MTAACTWSSRKRSMPPCPDSSRMPVSAGAVNSCPQGQTELWSKTALSVGLVPFARPLREAALELLHPPPELGDLPSGRVGLAVGEVAGQHRVGPHETPSSDL